MPVPPMTLDLERTAMVEKHAVSQLIQDDLMTQRPTYVQQSRKLSTKRMEFGPLFQKITICRTC
ncbi:hypothetical protein [Paraburkholderia sp. GAS42]|jgi:hypothetical protein|uniref:hypothetical protein n=1 Tax=Paraburkholderia sp. GAS42 TaxID=3035135 RepID=UPI003D251B93